MAQALDVAEYFLASVDEASGDNLSNLKLQKLLYYAQGFHLAIAGPPLFDDPILAWEHGPAVAAVYQHYKDFGSNAIPPPREFDFARFAPEVREILDEVVAAYGQFSAWKLRQMTHDEPPWRETPRNGVIGLESLRSYFATRLVHG